MTSATDQSLDGEGGQERGALPLPAAEGDGADAQLGRDVGLPLEVEVALGPSDQGLHLDGWSPWNMHPYKSLAGVDERDVNLAPLGAYVQLLSDGPVNPVDVAALRDRIRAIDLHLLMVTRSATDAEARSQLRQAKAVTHRFATELERI